MNILKTLVTIVLITIATISVKAQSNDALIGRWETTYEEDGKKTHVTYSFKKVNEKLKCYTLFIKDDNGKGENYDSIAMENIAVKEGKGKAKYLYNEEGKDYVFEATLNLKNKNTLTISYSYWGYSNTEVWRRLK